jgi:hypothetical protein
MKATSQFVALLLAADSLISGSTLSLIIGLFFAVLSIILERKENVV